MKIEIVAAEKRYLIEGLFRKYLAWLDIDELTEIIRAEIENFPGEYGEPGGCCLVALVNGQPAGCIAFRKLEDDICEMKRLYVDLEFRGARIGKLLIERALSEARAMGYRKMRLDVIASRMPRAVKLYESFGFCEIEQYGPEPGAGAKYFELNL